MLWFWWRCNQSAPVPGLCCSVVQCVLCERLWYYLQRCSQVLCSDWLWPDAYILCLSLVHLHVPMATTSSIITTVGAFPSGFGETALRVWIWFDHCIVLSFCIVLGQINIAQFSSELSIDSDYVMFSPVNKPIFDQSVLKVGLHNIRKTFSIPYQCSICNYTIFWNMQIHINKNS